LYEKQIDSTQQAFGCAMQVASSRKPLPLHYQLHQKTINESRDYVGHFEVNVNAR
jgi:hypothetical protein